jgi:hypothetical protein
MLAAVDKIFDTVRQTTQITADAEIQKTRILSQAEIEKAQLVSRTLFLRTRTICGVVCVLTLVGSVGFFFNESRGASITIFSAVLGILAGYGVRGDK